MSQDKGHVAANAEPKLDRSDNLSFAQSCAQTLQISHNSSLLATILSMWGVGKVQIAISPSFGPLTFPASG